MASQWNSEYFIIYEQISDMIIRIFLENCSNMDYWMYLLLYAL